jgi:RHS repeat-associated protein
VKRALALWVALLTLAFGVFAPSARADVFSEARVQPPELAAPQRGSVVGQLANVAFGAGEMSRGAFSLPSPFAVPNDRVALLASPFPTYSPEAGLTEWGTGWRANLRVTRGRWLGELDYATDDLDSPWGRLVRGDDGFFYPLGLSTPVRVEVLDDTLVAYLPNGERWTFGGPARITTPRGTYSWLLTSVTTPTGQSTTFAYDTNPSGQSFLRTVRAASVAANAWVEASFEYERLAKPLLDARSGVALSLDRRVRTVIVTVPDAVTGARTERWRYALGYVQDTLGPGFYLDQVTQTFASGESAPPTKYTYNHGSDLLARQTIRRVPKLDALAATYSMAIVEPYQTTAVDIDDDGRPDLESALDNRMLVQGDDGFTSVPLDPASPNVDPFCRHDGMGVRTVARLRNDESVFRVLHLQPGGILTTMRICSREGELITKTDLSGTWALGARVKLVDMNHDRQPDLVNVFAGGAEIRPNVSSAAGGYGFGEPVRLSLQPAFIASAAWAQDMNGDGVADLVARSGSDLVVWRGKGHFQFESEGQLFPLFDGWTQVSRLETYEMTWLDANKDGLSDVLLAYGPEAYLFLNTGKNFQRVPMPALRAKPAATTRVMALDLAGTGNTELVYLYHSEGYAIALDDAGTGLLATADDGRGTRLQFSYARASAGEGIRYRPSVLAQLSVTSTGHEPVLYEYGYAQPALHSAAQALLGFGRVSRRAPLTTDTLTFLNEDRYSGVLLSSVTHDELVPNVDKVEFRKYEEVTSFGLPWKRALETGQGWASSNPLRPRVALNSTRIETYEAEVCAQTAVETTPHGTLVTQHRRAELAYFAKHLACMHGTTVQAGTHGDASLDFRHTIVATHNDAGQVTLVQLVGAAETLDQQVVTYDESGLVTSVWSPGHGGSTYAHDAMSEALTLVRAPDGVVTEVADRDSRTGAVRALITDHGGAPYAQNFRYDGQERRERSWTNLGLATEARPNEQLTYRYATAQMPALVHVALLVDAQQGSFTHVADLSSARGESLAKAHRIPEGWAFDSVTRSFAQTRSSFRYTRLAANVDIDALTVDALYTQAQFTSGAQSSVFEQPVVTNTMLHEGVERDVATSLSLDDGLVRTDVENGQLATATSLDPSRRVTNFRDEARHATHYTYDAMGRLRRVLLADGARHGVDFDDFGRRARIDRDGVASVVYRYEPVTGVLAERTYLAGPGTAHAGTPMRRVNASYDDVGRMVRETSTDVASGAAQTFTFFYDGERPETPGDRTERGFLTAVVGEGYAKSLYHRADGAETRRVVHVTNARSVETQIEYGDAGETGRTVIVRDAWGTELTRDRESILRDAYGRVTGNLRDGQAFSTTSYDVNGLPFFRSFEGAYAHGEVVTLTRDPLTQKRVGMNQHNVAWSAAVSQRMNSRGLVEAENVTLGGFALTRAFAYTPERTLAQSTDAQASYAYEYDATGLTTRIASTLDGVVDERTVSRADNVLVAGSHRQTFDDLGRVVQRDDVTLTYGPNGQIARAARGGIEWTYLYDEADRRIAKLNGGALVAAYLDDGSYLDATGRIVPIRFDDAVVGVLREPNGGAKAFELTITDPRGTVLADDDGTPRIGSPYGDRATHPALAAAIDYATKGYDADLGAVRMGVRDYDPSVGRWLSADPLFLESPERIVGSPAEGNLYGYAKSDPVLYTDPSGTCVEDACILEGAAVAMAARQVAMVAAPRIAAVLATAGFASAASYIESKSDAYMKAKENALARRFPSDVTYVFATYTVPLADGSVYSGRTSGIVRKGENPEEAAERVVRNRWDAPHHMQRTAEEGAVPKLDSYTTGTVRGERDLPKLALHYAAIRGREHVLVGLHGGAASENGTSGNAIRAIAPGPLVPMFLAASLLVTRVAD